MSSDRAEARSRQRRRTRSHMQANRARSAPALSDLDRLDLVADLDAEHDVHTARHLAEVRVHGVQETTGPGTYEPLGVIADLDIRTSRDAERTLAERQVVQLGGLIPATCPIPFWVAALHDEVRDDAVEREPVVEAGVH